LAFVVIHTVFDARRAVRVPASLWRRVLCFHLDVSADHRRFLIAI
jgi:hypothetical protein